MIKAPKTNEETVQGWIDSPSHVTHRASEILEEIGWERGQNSTVIAWGIEFEKVILPDGRHIVVEHEIHSNT